MKFTSIVCASLLILLSTNSMGDGYPFAYGTHEVAGDSLQISLSDEQVVEVSSKGLMTFTGSQLKLLKKFYSDVPSRMRVVSSTYNDGLDIRDPNPVDCIWTSPKHVGITLWKKWQEGGYTFETEADPGTEIRISPDGVLFYHGSEISLQEASELVRNATTNPNAPDQAPGVRITLPPPYRERDFTKKNELVMKLFQQLVALGGKHGVVVHRYW